MSGIARYLAAQGEKVSGSDSKESATTEALRAMGCTIFIGHDSSHVTHASQVVISSAIRNDNPELQKAKELNLPILHRSKKLAELVNKTKGITIAGTHGKTSTSSMTASMLEAAGANPSFVVGGIVNSFSNNAGHGLSGWFVIEADESDGSLVEYQPQIAVLTNVEMDHLDYFKDRNQLDAVFLQYIQNIRPDGTLIYCADDCGVNELLEKTQNLSVKTISYGIDSEADLRAENIRFDAMECHYDVYYKDELLGSAHIVVPGKHNVLNSLAVIGIGLSVGLEFDQIAKGLLNYHGVQRRFQVIEKNDRFMVVDDYAHHPSEVRVTLDAARKVHSNRIISVFQPHRYSRTLSFWKDFAESFENADKIIISDIYSAGEDPIPDVTSQLIINRLKELKPSENVHHFGSINEIRDFIIQNLQPDDLVITMGAGDIWKVSKDVAEHIKGIQGEADS